MSDDRIFEATVLDVREQQRSKGGTRWQLLLEGHAGEGLPEYLEAVSRSGARLRLDVIGVERDGSGQLWYVVDKPLATGTRVSGVR